MQFNEFKGITEYIRAHQQLQISNELWVDLYNKAERFLQILSIPGMEFTQKTDAIKNPAVAGLPDYFVYDVETETCFKLKRDNYKNIDMKIGKGFIIFQKHSFNNVDDLDKAIEILKTNENLFLAFRRYRLSSHCHQFYNENKTEFIKTLSEIYKDEIKNMIDTFICPLMEITPHDANEVIFYVQHLE